MLAGPGQQAREQHAEPVHSLDTACLAADLAAQYRAAQLPFGVVVGRLHARVPQEGKRVRAAAMILLASFSG